MTKPKYFEALTMGKADCEHDKDGPGVFVLKSAKDGRVTVIAKDQIADHVKFELMIKKTSLAIFNELPNCSKCGQPYGLC